MNEKNASSLCRHNNQRTRTIKTMMESQKSSSLALFGLSEKSRKRTKCAHVQENTMKIAVEKPIFFACFFFICSTISRMFWNFSSIFLFLLHTQHSLRPLSSVIDSHSINRRSTACKQMQQCVSVSEIRSNATDIDANSNRIDCWTRSEQTNNSLVATVRRPTMNFLRFILLNTAKCIHRRRRHRLCNRYSVHFYRIRELHRLHLLARLHCYRSLYWPTSSLTAETSEK